MDKDDIMCKCDDMLFDSIAKIEEYSRYLVKENDRVVTSLKNKLADSADVIKKVLEIQDRIINNVKGTVEKELNSFDKLVDEVDEVLKELNYVDILYDNVCQLSGYLKNIEERVYSE